MIVNRYSLHHKYILYGLIGVVSLCKIHTFATEESSYITEERVDEIEDRVTIKEEIQEELVERFKKIFHSMSLFRYVRGALFSQEGAFFLLGLLILYNAPRGNSQENPLNFRSIVILFVKNFALGYIVKSVSACFKGGVLSGVLAPVKRIKIAYRLLSIILYTLFTGVFLLFDPIIATIIILLSLLICSYLTKPKEKNFYVYFFINGFFVLLTILCIVLIKYNIDWLQNWFASGALPQLSWLRGGRRVNRQGQNNDEQIDIEELLIGMGGKYSLLLWGQIKTTIFNLSQYNISDNGGDDSFYVFLKTKWNSYTQVWKVLDWIRGTINSSERLSKLSGYTVQNVLVNMTYILS